jgi:hypothetical protein
MTDRFTFDAAPYVLGALPEDERQAFEEHLAGCPDCGAEVEEFAGIPALLAKLPPAEVTGASEYVEASGLGEASGQADAIGTDRLSEPEPASPPAMLPTLLSQARRERRVRRWRTAVVGLAAAAVAVAGTLVAVDQFRDNPAVTSPGGAQTVAFRQLGQPIEATAVVSPHSWGTTVAMTCTYEGPPQTYGSSWYSLVALDKAGHRRPLSTWQVRPGEAVDIVANAPPRDQLSSLEVVNAAYTPVLHADL